MRRLLIINHAAELGGAEFGLLDVARHYGARCHVLLFADGPLVRQLAAQGNGVSILPAGRGVSGVRREAGRLRALASVPSAISLAVRVARFARGYDVLYANSQKAAVIAMLVARIIRRPLIWHLHDILSTEHFAPLQRQIVTRLANLAARRVILISEAGRRSFIDSGGDPARAVIVFNGVDQARFPASDQALGAELRRRLGLADAPVIGVFGRLTPWKGQHVVIEALALLPGVHALMVGDALFGEATYRDSLQRQASRLGVADRVHWLGQRDDVPALMAGVDIVVHASTSGEPFGRVIVEGMLARRPVLATDHGASRELLGDEPLALVPPGDPSRLADAVRAIFATPAAARDSLVARNFARATELFSLPAMLSGIERVVGLDRVA